jgi:hypothetical protein
MRASETHPSAPLNKNIRRTTRLQEEKHTRPPRAEHGASIPKSHEPKPQKAQK